MSALAISVQYSFGSPSHSSQGRKIKGTQMGKEEVKISLFADDMILYIENLKDSRKIPELVNEFGKDAGYKINTQKYIAFLHTSNEMSEREIKETIPFTITLKRIKYLGIQIGKEEVKLSLFADDMILCIENPKDSTRKLLELIGEFDKVAGYKINTH